MSNPFPALRAGVTAQTYLEPSKAFTIQLWVLSGVLGVSLLLVLASLGLRLRHGTFWVYRLHPSASGSWITPNPIICWLLWSTAFIAMAQVFIFYTLRFEEAGSDLTNAMIWRCVSWLPLYIAGLNLTWATALAPILSRTDTSPSSFDLARHPYLVNASFLFAHLALLGAILAISIDANAWFNRAFQTSQILGRTIDAASAAFEAGDGETVAALQTKIEELGVLVLAQSEKTRIVWRDLFIAYSSFEGVLTIGFFLAAFSHYKSLKISMQQLRQRHPSNGSTFTHQMKALVWTYRALVFTSCITASIASTYFTIGIYIAVEVKNVAAPTKASQIIQLLSLYVYAVLGSLTNIVMLVRSFSFASPTGPAKSPPLRPHTPSKWSTAEMQGFGVSSTGSPTAIAISFDRAIMVEDGVDEGLELSPVKEDLKGTAR
ncbi:hypothetical protein RQP46_006140 [Phenoliferia psychrophenolica]